MNDLITVVVPIYNVEKYLKRCIESIKNQTYKNIEIILINDGSTDNSGEICENLSKTDSRIITIHQKNQGLSSARNKGLYLAKGIYICFIDSDDYILEDYVETLHSNIVRSHSDISICEYYRSNELNIEIPKQDSINVEVLDKIEALEWLLSKKYNVVFTIACNKLYRTNLFIDNHIDFPVSKLHEDEFTTYKCLMKSNTVVYTNKKLYAYYFNSASITSSFNKKRVVYLEALKNRFDDLKELNEEKLTRVAHEQYILGILKCYYLLKENNICEFQHDIFLKFKKEAKSYLSSKYEKKDKKILLIFLFPKLYYFYLKKLKILKQVI